MPITEIFIAIIAAILGGAICVIYLMVIRRKNNLLLNVKAEKIVADAKNSARDIELEAKSEALKLAKITKQEDADRRRELATFEQQLHRRQSALDKRIDDLERRQDALRTAELELEEVKNELRNIRTKQQTNLEKIAGLTKPEARERVMKITERDIQDDLASLVGKLQSDAQTASEENARMILATTMERLASEQTAERTTSTIMLPSDEMKGRVIGKEGRNIQALERLTGVDFIIDETPGAIVLSSFDPIRREIARTALDKLLTDGRIHPGRIEEIVAKAQTDIEKNIKTAGEKAMKDTGIVGLPKELVTLLGQLKYRTSFSQNVLKHSVEMANMAGMIARDIGADVRIAKTAALLHDVGKAVTHEVEGGHHHIGGQLAEQYGLEPEIVHAITAHHDDVEATTPEALIVRIVDAMSASRPGARGDTHENYAKRMGELESLAKTFPGVSKCYAISAGRELRIIVSPGKLDDYGAIRLARSIAAKVEKTLRYPGVIKVSVIRETRAIEFAK